MRAFIIERYRAGETPRSIANALGVSPATAGKWLRRFAHGGIAGLENRSSRLHDRAYPELADLEASEFGADETGLWKRGLLIRRAIAEGESAFFSTWCPAGTRIETLVCIVGHRWAIEDSFATAKNELGLDHNETRSGMVGIAI